MRKLSLYPAVLLVCLSTAYGQATRTWVSGVGDDANPCSRTAPCKTFAGAFSKTATGGEIDSLDPGDFGRVTITKAITLDGGGGQVASVMATGATSAIIINTTGTVILRNLQLNGVNQSTSPGTIGVNIVNATQVQIEKCVIANFSNTGVLVSTTNPLTLIIDQSFIHDNTTTGVTVSNYNTPATLASVTDTTLENNGVGLLASGNSKVTVQTSIASGNTGAGFQADASAGSATINVLDSVSADNTGAGLQASSGGSSSAVIRMSGVSLFSNGSGLSIGANGNIFSYGDNEITGGGTPTSTLAKQ